MNHISSRPHVTSGRGMTMPVRLFFVGVAMVAALSALAGCAWSVPMSRTMDSAPAAEMAASADMSNAVAQEGGGVPATGASSALLARKMIARASLSMVVADAETTVDEIETMLEEVGGFIAASNLFNTGTGDKPVLQGNLQLRVPAEELDATLDKLEAMALDVGSRTLSREDVTDQYSDVDAQLRNLEATEAELREMLEEVSERPNAQPEDILAVHNRITEVRGQIEVLQGQQNLLDNLIGLSTIDLTLVPDAASLPVVETGWRPGNVVRAATRALVNTLQWLGNAIIWFVIAVLPVLLLLIFPLVVLFAFVRWIIMRRRGQKGITVR
ncbi:MAG: DUF4349 domain-containing protein [Caldilineaceae bacterium]